MNYYEHHIGDYAEATAHLTFIEDATYSRLIRKYYATEKPLPMDVKLVQRLINARSKEEKNAVVSVLNEFFTLTDEGWRQERCDHEIARFKDKQLKARRSAEGRWQSYPNAEPPTENPSNNACVRIATAMRTHCSPDTKHQSPVTNLHTPGKQNNVGKKEKISQGPPIPAQEEKDSHERNEKYKCFAAMISKEGRAIALDDYRIRDIVNLGVTEAEVADAITKAKETRMKVSNPTPINAGYVLAILKGTRKKLETAQADEDAWWKTNEGIDAKGRELDMRAQGAENYDTFKTRIFAELRKRQEALNAK
ncbi:YdaU family protein [Polynucleobacter sp. MWH-Aus1W21]|uniref:YdaU family protein n=1 Tax=Polynucleobacter sp. MWH-Aus1W21 TaxID=1855880 RepID=UPI001BFD1E81|nr:YdaU family protein [Polynucleobacter sp. MWH-Aus1W21]QWD67089.1 YdaU family protein [Polynucleobacter sp. MWH-Aus1W21]